MTDYLVANIHPFVVVVVAFMFVWAALSSFNALVIYALGTIRIVFGKKGG